jgi:hypothetical protein
MIHHVARSAYPIYNKTSLCVLAAVCVTSLVKFCHLDPGVFSVFVRSLISRPEPYQQAAQDRHCSNQNEVRKQDAEDCCRLGCDCV